MINAFTNFWRADLPGALEHEGAIYASRAEAQAAADAKRAEVRVDLAACGVRAVRAYRCCGGLLAAGEPCGSCSCPA